MEAKETKYPISEAFLSTATWAAAACAAAFDDKQLSISKLKRELRATGQTIRVVSDAALLGVIQTLLTSLQTANLIDERMVRPVLVAVKQIIIR